MNSYRWTVCPLNHWAEQKPCVVKVDSFLKQMFPRFFALQKGVFLERKEMLTHTAILPLTKKLQHCASALISFE